MDLLKHYLIDNNLPCNDIILGKFATYFDLLIEWNNKFNLTAITDCVDVQIKHFIDSLYGAPIVKHLAMAKCGESFDVFCCNSLNNGQDYIVLDVGSGAGFPSIPLAIIMGGINFVLIDSLTKRVNFLNEVINVLGLTNCRAEHLRAEDIPKTKLYDMCIARAVAPLNTLMEYLAPFAKIRGHVLCYKSTAFKEELALSENCLKELNCLLVSADEYTLSNTDITRTMLLFVKTNACKAVYPRPQNKPRTQPL